MDALAAMVDARADVSLVTDATGIERMARLNDEASLRFMRHGAYRAELLDWMRPTARNPQWQQDGLGHDALAMSALEARAASVVLGTSLFEWIDRIGMASTLVSERKATLTSSAVLCLHRANDESPIASGRALYRLWLQLTGTGLVAWPMAAVADDATSADELVRWQGLNSSRRYTAVLRIGLAPPDFSPRRVRRSTQDLVTNR